jgi:Putative Actinobacterial Holin-X, holin superfamily III
MAEQSLPNAFSKVITDLADLMQKEMRLVQAELSEKLSISIRACVWMSVGAVLAIVGGFLIVQAIVLGLSAATGIALHWSCLIVAAVLAGAAGAAFVKGKADVPHRLTPDRAINQVKQDIAAAKEQFT